MEDIFFNHISKILDNGDILHYSWYEAMHTRMDILLHGSDTDELNLISSRIHTLVSELDSIADRFNENSEISKINQLAGKAPIQVDERLFTMISACIEANTKTQGLFDITINSPGHSNRTIRDIVLDDRTRTIQLKDNTTLDLNGYVKGYALDQIGKVVLTSKIENALISLGNSSISGIGNQPFGKGWKVGTRNHPEAEVSLFNQCFTTSGNLFAERQHIRHPHSHQYITGEQTISVITPTGVVGEILSTALLLATETQKTEILRQFGLPEECLIGSGPDQ